MENLNNSDNQCNNIIDRKEAKRTINLIGVILFLFMIISQFIQLPIVKLLNLIDTSIASKPWYSFVLTIVCLYLIAFPIFLFLMKKIPAKVTSGTKKYSAKEILTLFLISYALATIFNAFSNLINYLISLVKGSDVINPLNYVINNSGFIYIVILTCIVAPIMEEIIFRKILLDRLNRLGSGVAIVVSSYAFALFHGNLSQFFYAFVLGMIFAHITLKSGTIKYSMILHLLINFTGAILSKLVLEFGETVTTVMGFVIFAMIISGIILFIKNRKKMFSKFEDIPNSMSSLRAIFAPGMLLFMLSGIIVIIYVISI